MNLEQLKHKKAELEARIEAIKNDFRQGLDHDSEERAVQLENAEVLNELMKQAMEELSEINAKLSRLQ